MKSLLMIAALSLISVSRIALADSMPDDNSGAYVGIGLASTKIYSSSCGNGGYFSSCSNEPSSGPKDDTHVGLIGGYDFNKHFGIEGGLSQLGTYRVRDYSGSTVGDFKASAYTLALKAGNTFSNGLAVFGKFGIASVKTDYNVGPGWVLTGDASQRSTGFVRGVIGQYNINRNVGFRISLEIIDYADAEFDNIVGGVTMTAVFKF
jgi:hypothetical protein